MLLKNKWAIFFVGATGVLATIVITKSPKSNLKDEPAITEETRKIEEIRKEEIRNNDSFNVFDYHLKPSKAYQVSFKRHLKGNMQKEGATSSFVDSLVEGSVTLNSVKYQNSTLYVIAQFALTKIESPLVDFSISYEFGLIMKKEKEKTKDLYTNTLLYEIAPNGRIRKIYRIPNQFSDDGIGLVTDAVAAMLYKLPQEVPPPSGGNVVRQEKDEANKEFPINLTYKKSGDLWIISGKSEILPVIEKNKGNKPSNNNIELSFSAKSLKLLDCVWDSSLGLPESLNWSLNQELLARGKKLVGGDMMIESKWKPLGESAFKVEDLSKYSEFVDLIKIKKLKQAIAEAKKKSKDAPPSWPLARTELSRVNGLNEADQGKFFNSLSETLKDNPSLVGEFTAEANRYPPGSRQISMILGALGYLGDAEAQKAMINIYQRPNASADEKDKVLIQLAIVQQSLTNESKNFLQDVYKEKNEDLSNQAGYALGASISHDHDEKLVQQFQQELQNANEPSKKAYLLQVMGNNRGPEFRNQVENFVSAGDPVIRAAAIDALRFAKDPAGRDSLFSAIRSEREVSVKNIAYKTLQYQPYDSRTRDTLSNCVNSEADEGVRSVCYDILILHMQEPDTRSILVSRSSGDPSQFLKNKIKSALK